MKRFPNKKFYLVTNGDIDGKQTQTIFTNKLRAYRFAAQIRSHYVVIGIDGKVVETRAIEKTELLSMNMKPTNNDLK